MFSQSPLIPPLSNLQVTRTGIKSQISLNLVGLFTTELFALECSYWLRIGKMMSPSFLSYYEFILQQTYFKLTGNKDRHKISEEFKFQSLSDQSFWSYVPLSGENNDVSFSQSPLIGSLSNFARKEDRHKSSNDFEIKLDRIVHFGVIRHWAQTFFP